MKKLLLLTGLLFLNFTLYSQKDSTRRDTLTVNLINATPNNYSPELAPLSPNAANFGKFGAIDINPSTGLANIGIKVFSLKAGDIPIEGELRYFSAGVKPNEHPGWVGQNWSLNAGGAVTRKVNGGVDEVAASFYGPNNTYYAYLYNYSLLNVSDWFSDAKLPVISSTGFNDISLQPDEFMFTLPNGETGSFFLNHLGNWVVKSKNSSGFKVTVDVGIDQDLVNGTRRLTINRIIYKITITDMNGYKYTFGNTMDAIEFSRSARPASTSFFNNEDVIANVWYLTKIESPTNKVVDLEYVRKEYQYVQSVSYPTKSSYDITIPGNGCSGFDIIPKTFSGQIISPVYLNKIKADNFTVNFGISTTTELAFPYVADMTNGGFYNQSGQWNFQDLAIGSNPNVLPSDIISASKWYQLNTIEIKEPSGTLRESYSFVYSADATKRLNLLEFHKKSTETGKEDLKHTFTYDTTPLPTYNSLKVDKWGYYNNKQYPSFISSQTIAQLNSLLDMDADFAQAGVLKRITYPTGGFTDFTYEANDYSKVIQKLGGGTKNSEIISLLSQTGIGDGLRIKNIVDNDNLGNASNSKQYDYKFTSNATSSGISGGLRKILFNFNLGNPVVGTGTLLSTFDASALIFTEGKDIVYSEVTEKLLDGSSKIFKYANSDNPAYIDEIPVNTVSTAFWNVSGTNANITSSYSYPAIDQTSKSLERGLLLSQETKNGAGVTIHKIENTYNASPSRLNKFVRSVSIRPFSISCPGRAVNELYYFPIKNYTYIPFLETQKEYIYDQITTAAFLINSKKFAYDDNGLLLSTTSNESKTKPITLTNGTTLDEDRTIETSFTHPKDYPSDATLTAMVAKNIIAPVIEKTTELNIINISGSITSVPVSYEKNTYSLFGTSYLPQKIEVKIGVGTLYTPITFNTYDSRANLTKYTLRNGQSTVLTYYGTTDLGKTDLLKTQTVGGGSTGTVLSRTMSYDYIPLVGLSSSTDINGYSTTFLYDGFNRLISVKDPQNYLLKDLNYHYANQAALSGLGVTPTNTMNYIVSRTARESQTTATLDSDVDKTTTQLEYLDGLGKSLQSLIWKGTPDKLKDIISGTTIFDAFGRPYKSILPTPSDALTGAYKSTAQTLATAFYDGDTYPYNETIFEASPLNRPIKQFGAGQAWRTVGNEKFIEMQYQIAGAGVFQFNLQNDGSVKWVNTYPTSSLFNNVTKSERGFQTLEVKDRQGRVTHKYQQIEGSFNFLITGYVYNDINQLIAVIPPEAYKRFGTGTIDGVPQVDKFQESDILFKEGIYGYHYDNLGRLIEKHVPGAGWEYFCYDKNDRIVYFADDSDKAKDYWQWIKYDALGRKIQSGIQKGNGIINRAALQTAFDGMTTETYEERGSTLLGYTNRSFPVGYEIIDANILQVIYYDDYGFNSDVNYNFQTNNAFHSQGLAKGLMTGTLIRNIETNDWYKFLNYYDYKARNIQSFSQNHVGGIDRTDYGYRFNNEVLSMRLTHIKTGANNIVELYEYDYDHIGRKTKFRHNKEGVSQTVASYNYDDLGRLSLKNIKPIYQIGSICTCPWINPKSWSLARVPTQNDNVIINIGTDITIPAGEIANAGSLTFKGGILRNYGKLNLGNFGSNLSSNSPNSLTDPIIGTLQSVDYKYHIRGGLRGLNLDASNNTTIANGDLFSMKLGYETDGYFDENIGKQEWKTSLDNVNRSFNYRYDGASRITRGTYAGVGTENYSLDSVNYDANGNIKMLTRRGYKSNNTFGIIDNLNYTYQNNSNKIQKIDDASSEIASFKDVTGATDYTYYLDGSLKSDANKGITLIEYNYLKKQSRITFSNGTIINYLYDASGKKLRETIGTQVTDYVGNKIYKNNILYQIAYDEGRIVDGIYEYNINDHLGNLRVAFKDSLGIAKIVQNNAYGIWGEDLPTLKYLNTPKINNFGYLNRELQPETGYTDLVNRQFDNIIGRFTSQDPITDEQEHLSLYQYGWNNPVLRSDADGLMPGCCGEFLNGVGTGFINTFKSIGNAIAHPINTLVSSGQNNMAAFKADPVGETINQAINATPLASVKEMVNFGQALASGDNNGAGQMAGGKLAQATIVIATEGAGRVLSSGSVASKSISTKSFASLPETGSINPNSIKFSQGSISGNFKNGGSVADLADGLKNGSISPTSIPAIRIVAKDGSIFTLDNRRLQAFQQAGVSVPYQKLESIPQSEMFKFKDYNSGKTNGTSVKVRGQ